MAARTAANQTGYLLGAVVGGATLALSGYAALGIVLAAGLALCALLVMRVIDPLAVQEREMTRSVADRPPLFSSQAKPPIIGGISWITVYIFP